MKTWPCYLVCFAACSPAFGGSIVNPLSLTTVTSSVTINNAVSMGSAGNAVKITTNTVIPGTTFYANAVVSLDTTTRLRLASRAQPSGLISGDMWNDSTRNAISAFVSGSTQTLSGTLWTMTVSSEDVNSTGVTNIVNTGVGTNVLPANFFTVGKSLYMVFYATYTTTLTPTLTVASSLGGTSVINSGAIAQLATTGVNVLKVEVLLTCRTTGASGTIMTIGRIDQNTGTTGVAGIDLNSQLTTINTTAAQAINVNITWGTASISNDIMFTNGMIKVLN